MADEGRVTHVVIEVAATGDPEGRVTQVTTEVLSTGDPAGRVTHEFIEVLYVAKVFRPGAGALVLDGQTPGVNGAVFTLPSGALVLAGLAPTVAVGAPGGSVVSEPGVAALVLFGTPPPRDKGTLTSLIGTSESRLCNIQLGTLLGQGAPFIGELVLQGYAPTVTAESPPIEVPVGALVLVGLAPVDATAVTIEVPDGELHFFNHRDMGLETNNAGTSPADTRVRLLFGVDMPDEVC